MLPRLFGDEEESLQSGGRTANERRQVDVCAGREAKKRKAISGNDYRLISLFILPLKGEGETRTITPSLPCATPVRTHTYCVATETHIHTHIHGECQPLSDAPIGRPLITLALLHSFRGALGQIRFTLSINNFLRSSVPFSLGLSFSLLHCGMEGPTCKQFLHEIKLRPVPFQTPGPRGPPGALVSAWSGRAGRD